MYDWDYITITVKDPSAPLTANAGGGSLSQYENEINNNFKLFGSALGGNPPYTYKWDLGDGRKTEGNNPTIKYTDPGEYTVTLIVTDENGDTATDNAQVTITVRELDVIIMSSPSQIKQGQIISFMSSISGGKAPYAYMWDFGDGTVSDEPYPSHAYKNDGTYEVELTVTDILNNKKTVYNTISVEKSEETTEELISVTAGFGLKATIKSSDEPVTYSINIDGSIFFGGNTNGEIAANTEETVKVPFSLGLGKVYIVVTVNQILYKYEAFMLGPFIINLNEYYG
jgi:PKD repeat protein